MTGARARLLPVAFLTAGLQWAAGGCTRTANLGSYPVDAGRDMKLIVDGPASETSDAARPDAPASPDGVLPTDGALSTDGANDRQDAGGGFPVTPITTDQGAAGALLAAMLTETDVYNLTAFLTNSAEDSARDLLGLASAAGVSLAAIGDRTDLPAPSTVPCPEGGNYTLTWSNGAPAATGDAAKQLLVEYHDCRGLQTPAESSWIVQNAGPITVGAVRPSGGEWRVSSVQYGSSAVDFVHGYINRQELVLESQTSARYTVSGTFIQQDPLVGAFAYRVNGQRSESSYYKMAGDPSGTLYSTTYTAQADELIVDGSRSMQGSDWTIELHYRSGTLVSKVTDPTTTTAVPFAFHDLAIGFDERDSEGNKSFTLDGIVSVTYPQAAGQGCASGTFQLGTTLPMLDYTSNHGVFPQISQGSLRINDNVSVSFLRQEELQISLGENAPVVYRGATSSLTAVEMAVGCFLER